MAYVKQNWECGEMITADKLNHMEDGIANGGASVLVVRPTSLAESGNRKFVITDKTLQEVSDAIANGTPCYVGFDIDSVCDAETVEAVTPMMCPILGIYDGNTVRFITLSSEQVDAPLLIDGHPSGYLAYPTQCGAT